MGAVFHAGYDCSIWSAVSTLDPHFAQSATYTQIVCGVAFNVDQATVSRDVSYLEPVVRMCPPIPEKMHAAANMAKNMEDLEALIPGLAALVDVSEQQMYQPHDDETQSTTRAGPSGVP